MKKLLLIISSMLCSIALWAQVYTEPTFVTSETNETFYVYYDATQGSGMVGVDNCYAHTGVITTASNGQWTHAPAWGTNTDKYKMTEVSEDLWKLEITDGLKEYYGLADNEVVTKLAFVFRTADNSREGKTSSGEDIFYELFEVGKPAVTILTPADRSLQVMGNTIAIKGEASMKGTLDITVNGEVVASETNANALAYDLLLTTTGTHEISLTLTAEGEVIASDKVSFYVTTPVTEKQVPEQYLEGINYHTDSDSITLVLRAPLNENVYIIGDFNNWDYNVDYQMYRADVKSKLDATKDSTRLFWRTFAVEDPTKKYAFQYLVDGRIKISDPYSEVVLDKDQDKYITSKLDKTLPAYPDGGKSDGLVSVLEGPKAKETYEWQVTDFERPLPKDLVIYELLVRDFSSSKTLKAVIDKLDYLKTLGINAIELMPVTEFDGNDSWGYNPNHFFAYDKAYGTRNQYKQFVDECHKKGIAVIIDMVFNHATGQFPMAKLYWDGNATASNNPWFNRVAKHPYNVYHDINHEYSGTRHYFKRVLQYWVEEYKVDGFRMDLTKGLTQTDSGDNVAQWGRKDESRIVIIKDYCDAAKSINPNTYFIIEHLSDYNEEEVYAKYGILPWRNMNHNYCQAAKGTASNSNFADNNNLSNASKRPNCLGGMFAEGWVGYAESHDEERTMYKASKEGDAVIKGASAHAARMARVPAVMAFTTLIPGPKMIWQFQELGYDYSINYCMSNGKNSDACRTNAKPVPWSLKWDQDPDRWAAYEACAKIISLRTKNPEIFRAENFSSVNLTGSNWDKPRRMDISYKDPENAENNIDIIILANFSTSTSISTTANAPQTGIWYSYLTGEQVNIRRTNQILNLKPGELVILMSKKLDNVVSIDETLADNNTVIVLPTIAEDIVTVIAKEAPSAIEVFDLSGNLVAKTYNSEDISIAGLNKGHYLVRVLIEDNISTHRIIKK